VGVCWATPLVYLMADPYRLWEALGVWAGAAATFSAVLVSLRLARRAERPRLLVTIDERVLVDPSNVRDPGNVRLEDFPDVIVLTVINVGVTRVRVNSVGWHWFLIRGKGALQNPPEISERSHAQWPTVLEHGDQLQWVLSLDLVGTISRNMLAENWWWQLKLRLLCVTVGTSTGNSFRGRLGPTLRQTFASEVKRLRASGANPAPPSGGG
jgi:hypothetical protein